CSSPTRRSSDLVALPAEVLGFSGLLVGPVFAGFGGGLRAFGAGGLLGWGIAFAAFTTHISKCLTHDIGHSHGIGASSVGRGGHKPSNRVNNGLDFSRA